MRSLNSEFRIKDFLYLHKNRVQYGHTTVFPHKRIFNTEYVTHFPRTRNVDYHTNAPLCGLNLQSGWKDFNISTIWSALYVADILCTEFDWKARPIHHYDENLHLCTPSHVVVSEVLCRCGKFSFSGEFNPFSLCTAQNGCTKESRVWLTTFVRNGFSELLIRNVTNHTK